MVFPISCSKKTQKSSDEVDVNQKIVLKVAHSNNQLHYYQMGLEKFKEVLEKETKGNVEVKIFPNSQLGNKEQETLGIKQGIIDGVLVSSDNLTPLVPQIELFNLPFLFRDLDHFYRVLDGSIGQLIGRLVEDKFNCIFLGYCSTGIRNVWNNKKPVLTPNDLNGLKIRVMNNPILISTFNAFGIQAVTMSWNGLYSALQQGDIDGAEGIISDLLLKKFYEVTKYVSLTNHLIGTAVFVFSRNKYQELPPYVQTTVLDAGRAAVLVAREAEAKMSKEALGELKKKGLKFYSVDKELFKEKAQPFYETYVEKLGSLKLIEQIERQ